MRTSAIQLHCSTGYPNVDQLLIDLIGSYERSGNDRIRGYYLVGSYSDRSAVPDSDIDMGVLFKGSLTDDERQRFRHLTHECSLLSPIRLDCSAIDEAHFLKEAAAGAKMALVVYGEDVLDQIPLEPIEKRIRRSMIGAFHYMWILRQKAQNLVFPLAYPDTDGVFFGYERWGTFYGGSAFGPGIRVIVNMVTQVATTTVALKAHQHVGTKSQSIQLYRKHIGDRWAAFLEDVYNTFKTEWQYRLPESEVERDRLGALCSQLLGLENDFLAMCREPLLASLHHDDSAIRGQAIECLWRIAYRGNDFVEALAGVANAGNQELQPSVEGVLATIRAG
jgi:hypothetical protein